MVMAHASDSAELPVISNVDEFDMQSGSFIERLVFNNRGLIVIACILSTIFLGYYAFNHLQLQAGFEKMLPKNHPYVRNYKENEEHLKGLGNVLRLALQTPEETIYTPHYLQSLREASDAVFYIPGVSRESLKSLWTPNTRYRVVTEEGFEGDSVVPAVRNRSAWCASMSRAPVCAATWWPMTSVRHR
jgi:uncharacterized protein